MTREDAYYLKHLLMSGVWDAYEEELNGYLESEEPLSDIAIELAFYGSDVEKVIYELGCYCSEQPFDEDAACHKLRLFLKKAYESNEMTKDEVVHSMYRFALQHEDIFSSDSDVWYSMYILHDYYDLAEIGVVDSRCFDQGFLDFLNDGTLVSDEKMTAGVWSKRILRHNEVRNVAKKRYKETIKLSDAIKLIVIGVLMGTVFTFGMQFWNKPVTRDACQVVETFFVDYEIISGRRRVNEIQIECADQKQFYIDGATVTHGLREELSALSAGEKIKLLIHPNSSVILEFTACDEMLLEFEDTMEALEGEAGEFLYLGLGMYALALYGVYWGIKILRRRNRNKR